MKVNTIEECTGETYNTNWGRSMRKMIFAIIALLLGLTACGSSGTSELESTPVSEVSESTVTSDVTSEPTSAPSVASAIEEVLPSVVRVVTEYGMGSGVIIDAEGYILTNNHVITGADDITVLLPDDDEELPATVIGQQEPIDIAILKIEAGDLVEIDLSSGTIKNLNNDMVFTAKPYPDFMAELIAAGGLIEHTQERVRRS